MKKLIFAILIATGVYGVVSAEDQMLFGGIITHGGFGAPAIKFTQIKDENAILVGGRGGWIINHCLVIGGGGYGLVNENIDKYQVSPGHTRFLSVGYGGLEMEYIAMSHRLFHPTLGMLIGGGSVNYLDRYHGDIDQSNDDFDGFFIFEPSASIELNIMPFWRTDIGVSYRFVSGIDSFGLKDSDISGLSGVITLKFGKF
jgi:hypothetical protein